MNKYLKNVNKIEFVVTNVCTGKCKHCSQGDHLEEKQLISVETAVDAVRKILSLYDIKTVMTFGGEPLLHKNAVFEIMKVAYEMNIPKRQLITNGYFTKDINEIKEVAKEIASCHINNLLLSVDAFHQETIPLEIVRKFAEELIKNDVPFKLQPAWLVSQSDNNQYNIKTKEILNSFSDLDILISEGNVIYPEGNAVKYLSEYFNNNTVSNPYEDDPYDITCISFSANGDVLDDNINQKDIIDIIKDYNPNKDK